MINWSFFGEKDTCTIAPSRHLTLSSGLHSIGHILKE
jgi:hypothetical protein